MKFEKMREMVCYILKLNIVWGLVGGKCVRWMRGGMGWKGDGEGNDYDFCFLCSY